MDSKYEFEEIIQDAIAKLNADWFDEKNAEFKKHSNYVTSEDSLVFFDGAYERDEHGVVIDSVLMEPKRINFIDYCSLYQPIDKDLTYYGAFKYNDSHGKSTPDHCTKEYADTMVDELSKFVTSREPETVYKFIGNILGTIRSDLNKLKSMLDQPDYSDILEGYFSHCRRRLNHNFRKELMVYDVLDSKFDPDELVFRLDKPERLASLIYILVESGLTLEEGDKILPFCYYHFRMFDIKKDKLLPQPKDLRTFREYYNRIERTGTSGGLLKIKEMLTPLLDQYQPKKKNF